jgi:hypothetical protein
MLTSNAYAIRTATDHDSRALRQIAELDSQSPVAGPALVGEIAGRTAAALSLTSGRAVADPFQETAQLVSQLRLRARALEAVERTPSLHERMIAGVRLATRPRQLSILDMSA